MIERYEKPDTFGQAMKLKHELGDAAGFLAGGSELNRLGSPSGFRVLIDLSALGLDTIRRTDIGVEIGACVSFQQAADSGIMPDYVLRALLDAGSRTLRNQATLGGNVAAKRGDSYLLPILIAAKARLIMTDLDPLDDALSEESVPIREYMDHQDLYHHSLIRAICLDKPNRFAAGERFSRSKQGPAAITIAFGADYAEPLGTLTNVRIVIGTVATGLYRLLDIERAVNEGAVRSAADLQQAVSAGAQAEDDFTGSAVYKKYLAGTAIADCYARCLTDAQRKQPVGSKE